jgi:hypothetical protein
VEGVLRDLTWLRFLPTGLDVIWTTDEGGHDGSVAGQIARQDSGTELMHLFDPGTGENLTVDPANTRRISGMEAAGSA